VDTGYVVGSQSGAILKTIKGGGSTTSVPESPLENQASNILIQNYPNPFSESTTISWDLPQDAHVVLKIFDFTGHEMKTVVDCEMVKGEHQVTFNPGNLQTGVYICRLQAENTVAAHKMILIK
jgi:hypothetical protein